MAEEKKKKSSLFGKMLGFLIVIALIFVISLAGAGAIDGKRELAELIDIQNMASEYFLYLMGGLTALYFVILLTKAGNKKPNETKGPKIKTKGDVKKFYDTNWLSESELINNPTYKYTPYNNLKNVKSIGIPIRAEYKNGKLHINMFQSIHTIVIGTTGAGKTTQFVDPVMQILSESAAKPCLVISDPKGEICALHGNKLLKQGYRLMIFDLREPFKSTCWNPMTRPYELNEEANSLHKKIKVHQNEDPRKTNLTLASKAYYSNWYELDGYAFGTKAEIDTYIDGKKQKLKNDAFNELKDLATVISPVVSQQDPVWERGARDMILATMLAMLEDSEDPRLGMTKEKYNFYNLTKILNAKDNDPYDSLKTLKQYFQGRDKLSMCVQLSNHVTTNNEKTASSYMGVLSDKISLFNDTGICYATSVNEMNLTDFCSKPTALFIKIPDEVTTRHPIATMFIAQLYKILVDIAAKNGGSLPRPTFYLLDEFGNLPKIEGFDTMITVARSRKIFFILILQSYAQLTIKYGNEVGRTVEDNCNIHMYIASNDRETQEKFSKRCGNITVETESTSVSDSKDKDGKGTGKSSSTSIQVESRPLIYPEELGSLKDDFIVSILKQPPIKSVFTPAYKINNYDDPRYGKQSVAPIYDMIPLPEPNTLPKQLDEVKMYYDIRKRNEIVLGNTKKDSFDW